MEDDKFDAGFGEVIAHPDAVWKDQEPPLPQMIAQRNVQLENERVQALALPEEFTPTHLAKLAREIAMDIKEVPIILGNYRLTQEQYDWLKENNEFFKQALHVSTIEWNSALTTPERIKLESAAILEEALPRLGARMVNQAEGLPGVVEAAKLFAKIAGVGEREQGDRAPGEKFTISINLGGDDKLVYKSKDVTPEATGPSTISINTEGSGGDS